MTKNLYKGKQKKLCNNYEINIVNGAITKRGVNDMQLAAFFQETYYNIGKKCDTLGRSALHMAASCGRCKLCEWLITVAKADINRRDLESGYTPLHRAVFHGHIMTTVKLMQLGADLTILDNEGLTAVDIITKDRPKQVKISAKAPCQVYLWGLNDSYTLGTGTNKSRKVPELLDNFKRRNVSITQVCMDKFHCVFVSQCNRIWVCGNSHGGRLGIISEKHVLTPSLLLSNNECLMAAVALNHTLLLNSSGIVLACGQNEHYQLGIYPYLKESTTLKPVFIKPQEDLIGVCAGKYHSVFYTKRSLFVCGLNGGQLGLSADQMNVPFVKVPTQVPINLKSDSIITSVSSSSTCIVFSVSSGSIYILYQYLFKKIASKQLNIKQICTSGGSLNTNLVTENGNSLKVVLLTSGGCILIWQESVPQLTRCMFGLSRLISITSIFLNEKQILFTTGDGEAFSGTIGQIEKQTVSTSKEEKSGFHKFIEKNECYHISSKRIPNVHRAVAITSDPKGENFAVIQVHPQHALVEVPVQSQEHIFNQLLQFFNETSVTDTLHDINFKVKNILFPAHKYIVACANSSLLSLPIDNGVIIIDDILPEIFNQILLHIYTGQCSLLKVGRVGLNLSTCSEDPLKLLLNASNKYKLSSLYKQVSCFKYEDGCVKIKTSSIVPEHLTPKFTRNSFPELYDVMVQSEDGKFINAHKCILAARLDYFHNMLLGGWIESVDTPVLHLECGIKPLEILIDFLYTNEIPVSVSTESFEHLRKLLVISDQLLCNELKTVCEISLVNVLNLKNAGTMLQVSYIYNAPQLKKSVMQFITLNLDTIIENRILDNLGDEILLELDEYIQNFNSVQYCKRIITPYNEHTVPDKAILSCAPEVWPENIAEIKNNNEKEKQPKTVVVSQKKKVTPSKKSPSPEVLCEDTRSVAEPVPVPKEIKIESVAYSPSPPESYLNSLEFPSLDTLNINSIPNNKVQCRIRPGLRKVLPPKLSQKERKRQSLELEEKAVAQNIEETTPKPQFKGWRIIPPPPKSLSKEDDENYLDFSPPNVFNFVEIIANEKQKKSNFLKMKTKSFNLTQLEDKAMEDLYEFYNVSNVFDERISVHRVLPINVAQPTWIKSNNIP